MSIPGNGHLPAAASTGLPDHSSASSDSEVEVEVEGDADYLPISGAASDTDSDTDPDPDLASHRRLDAVDNGVSQLDLASDEEESDEEEATGATEAAASLDDERRRRAQLPAGAAARIVDAMRGVAFPGALPPWAGAVPDEQWLERLRSLRGGRD